MNIEDPIALDGGYELEAVAARTEHSMVFVAQERRSSLPVAVKIAHDPDGADALRREIQLLRGLRHPHIVRVIDAVAIGDPWLVMPLAAASLEDVVVAGRAFAAAEVVGVVVAIAAALDAVHRHRLVHGDVKPSNILFAADGCPLLADFGAAHAIGRAPTNFTPTYFVDDGIEGDVAALARSALSMFGDDDGRDMHALRAVLHEFARMGDRPETLVEAVTAVVAEARWPEIRAVGPGTDSGPPTHPFGPGPPPSIAGVAPQRARHSRRIVAVAGLAILAVGAMHLWREYTVPPPAPVEQPER